MHERLPSAYCCSPSAGAEHQRHAGCCPPGAQTSLRKLTPSCGAFAAIGAAAAAEPNSCCACALLQRAAGCRVEAGNRLPAQPTLAGETVIHAGSTGNSLFLIGCGSFNHSRRMICVPARALSSARPPCCRGRRAMPTAPQWPPACCTNRSGGTWSGFAACVRLWARPWSKQPASARRTV